MFRSIARRTTLGRTAAIAVAAALSLSMAACGGDDGDDASGSGDGGLTKVKVGVIPIVDVAPIYLGVKQGFFKDEGLDVTLETAQGGAAIVPGVVSGQYQFGFSNNISLMLANTQGVPLKIVSAGVNATDDPAKDFGGVIVPANSPIKRPRDLAGKKVGVNTLNNINTTTTNELVRQDGGDPSTIEYVELGFPDIVAAVAKGDVDAGQVVEPFLTIGTQQGDRNLGSNYAGVQPGLPVASYFTSEQYDAKSGDTVDAFTSAMEESLEYADAHPDEVREILATYTDIDPKVQAALQLPKWTPEIDESAIQKLADLAKSDGLFKQDPDLDKLLP